MSACSRLFRYHSFQNEMFMQFSFTIFEQMAGCHHRVCVSQFDSGYFGSVRSASGINLAALKGQLIVGRHHRNAGLLYELSGSDCRSS